MVECESNMRVYSTKYQLLNINIFNVEYHAIIEIIESGRVDKKIVEYICEYRSTRPLPSTDPILGYQESAKKMGLRQVGQGFSSFFVKCLPYIFKVKHTGSCCRTLKNHQKWQTFGKK